MVWHVRKVQYAKIRTRLGVKLYVACISSLLIFGLYVLQVKESISAK
jgi:hypothetical protein